MVMTARRRSLAARALGLFIYSVSVSVQEVLPWDNVMKWACFALMGWAALFFARWSPPGDLWRAAKRTEKRKIENPEGNHRPDRRGAGEP